VRRVGARWRGAGLRPAAAAALAALAACGGDDPPAPAQEQPVAVVELPSRDLDLLELMLALNPPFLGIQPELRNPAAYGRVAAAADTLATLAEDPRFTGWTARPGFGRDPQRFETFRRDFSRGATEAAAAARAGDPEALHRAYTTLSMSCVACHKRYSPHQ
jgi:cytochrome c556